MKKHAGSNIYFSKGRKMDLSKALSPSTSYHYSAQGKYTDPILHMDRKESKFLNKIDNQTTYIDPSQTEAYIKAYDKSVRKGVTNQFSKWEKKKIKKKFLGIIPYTKKKRVVVTDKKGIEKRLNDPEFKKQHLRVLGFMNKNRKTGFSVGVG